MEVDPCPSEERLRYLLNCMDRRSQSTNNSTSQQTPNQPSPTNQPTSPPQSPPQSPTQNQSMNFPNLNLSGGNASFSGFGLGGGASPFFPSGMNMGGPSGLQQHSPPPSQPLTDTELALLDLQNAIESGIDLGVPKIPNTNKKFCWMARYQPFNFTVHLISYYTIIFFQCSSLGSLSYEEKLEALSNHSKSRKLLC